MVNAGGSPTRDTIEAHSFLTAPATITIKAGTQTTTCTAPAGVSICTAPLAVGEVSADVTRAGAVSAGVTSPQPVTATPYVQDLHYTAATTGRNPAAVVAAGPNVLSRPYLSGAARVGKPLYCRGGKWSDANGVWFTWYRNGARIPNSNTNTRRVSAVDLSKRLHCRVTAWGVGGSNHAYTQSARISTGILARIKSPKIAGKARTGRTLTARVGAWLPVPAVYSFQWYRGSHAINGATNSKYKVKYRDRGRYIRVKVTAKIPGYDHAAVKSSRVRALR